MATGLWHIKSVNTASLAAPIGPVTVGASSLALKISPPEGRDLVEDEKADIDVQRFGMTVAASTPNSPLVDTLLKTMGLTAAGGAATRMGMVKNVVKAVTGNAVTNTVPDLMGYFGPSAAPTIGVIMPNRARMDLSLASKIVSAPGVTRPEDRLAFAASAAASTMLRPAPPLTKETLSEGGMQSLVFSAAMVGGMDVGVFFFGLPVAAMGMPWAPWFASAFGIFVSAGLMAKLPGAQLGTSFWHGGKIVQPNRP